MLLRNGLSQGVSSAAQRHLLAFQPCRTARRAAQRKLVVQPAATAAPAADSAAAKKAPRKYAPRKPKEEDQPTQPDEPELPVVSYLLLYRDKVLRGSSCVDARCPKLLSQPQPLDYQQTVIRSFTIGGVGLHSGEYGESAAAGCGLRLAATHTLLRTLCLRGTRAPGLEPAHRLTGRDIHLNSKGAHQLQ